MEAEVARTDLEWLHECPEEDAYRVALSEQFDESGGAKKAQEAQINKTGAAKRGHQRLRDAAYDDYEVEIVPAVFEVILQPALSQSIRVFGIDSSLPGLRTPGFSGSTLLWKQWWKSCWAESAHRDTRRWIGSAGRKKLGPRGQKLRRQLTSIIKMSVLKKIMIMMKYSKGVETASFHSWYFSESGSSGMKRDTGLAFKAKSMHCFLKFLCSFMLNLEEAPIYLVLV